MKKSNKSIKHKILSFIIVMSFFVAMIPSASAITIIPNIQPNIPDINFDLIEYEYTVFNGKVIIDKYKGTGTNITIPSTINGSPVDEIAYLAFNGCKTVTSIKVPDSVTKIGMDTFRDCTNLKTVILPDSITSIGLDAFANCVSLETINLPNKLQTIELGTFNGCVSLKNITIPESVTTLQGDVFYDCTGLTSITIPKNVETIYGGVFFGCTNLTSIDVDSNNPFYVSVDGILYSKDMTVLVNYPNGLTAESFTIPSTVKKISANSFGKTTNLKSVTIPSSVTMIGSSAFQQCGLTSVVIPNTVTKLESKAFQENSSLTNATIGSGLSSLPDAFMGCTKLKNVSIISGIKDIGEYAFLGCSGLTSINIPSSVTTIGMGAFSNCKGLTGIALPYSITSVKQSAFKGCSNLHNVWFYSNAPTIGGDIFANCASDFKINYLSDKSGWSTPKWKDYPAAPFEPLIILPINPVLPLNPVVTPDPKITLPIKPFIPFDPTLPSTTSSSITPEQKTITDGAVVIKLYLGKAGYNVNGISHTMDANPILNENRIFLPVRYIAEPLGADPVWYSNEKKVEITMGSTVIELWIGNNTAKVNGVEKAIDPDNPNVKPVIIPPGRTMLPLRFIGECLGCEVSWDQTLQEATLTRLQQ